MIFKEIRLPFQGNFAFPVSFFVLFLRRPESPALPLQQDDYENFAPFSGFSKVSFICGYIYRVSLRVNLL